MKRSKQNLPLGFCLKLITIAAALGYGVKLYRSWISSSDTFLVRRIEVTGNDLVETGEILRMGELAAESSIWGVHLPSVEKKINGNPFIQRATIHRKLPAEIHVIIEEKHPVALLNFRGKLYCVDHEGIVLPSRPGKLYDLPILSGAFGGGVQVGSRVGGNQVHQGLGFLQRVMEDRPKLYAAISEIIVGRPEGLVVTTKQSGIPVWIGSEDTIRKIRYFEAILERLSEFGDLSGVEYIDLRFMGQIVVGMRA
jgi:cell division septal protein FtsQ